MASEPRTTEQKAQDYTAMGHSVSLIDLIRTDSDSEYTKFVPILVKAVQEQQAVIESLTARIAALES